MTTFNPSDKNANITLSGGDLTAVASLSNQWAVVKATDPKTTGRYYIEITLDNFPGPVGTNTPPTAIGFCNSSQPTANNDFLGDATNNGIGAYINALTYWVNNAALPQSSGRFNTNNVPDSNAGNVYGVWIDFDNRVAYLRNITLNAGSYKPMDLNAFFSTGLMFAVAMNKTTATNPQVTVNFGATAFVGTVPTDFASGWAGTVPALESCRWSVWRSSPIQTISGALSNVCSHGTQNNWHRIHANTHHNTGKWYCEFIITHIGQPGGGPAGKNWQCGISAAAGYLNSIIGDYDNLGIGYFPYDGQIYKNNTHIATVEAAVTSDLIGMAVDFDGQKIWWRKNGGNWNNDASQNPATGAGGVSIASIMDGVLTFAPTWAGLSMTATCTALFGQEGFSYTVPSGFVAWSGDEVAPETGLILYDQSGAGRNFYAVGAEAETVSDAFVGAIAKNASDSASSNFNFTVQTWGAEDVDTNTFHDTGSNTSRITIPSAVNGRYGIFKAFVNLANVASNSSYAGYIQVNGSPGVGASLATFHNDVFGNAYLDLETPPLLLNTGDYYEVVVHCSDTAVVLESDNSSFSLYIVG